MRRRRHHRPKPKPQVIIRFRANEKIAAPVVFLIGSDGTPRGEMPTEQALEIAREEELDLIEVSPQADPPVCKILDYGKFQYQQTKKEQQAKSNQKKVDIKGIRIGLRVDKHDLDFKRTQAEKFLTKGQKVRIELLLRGREKAMRDRAKDAMREFLATLTVPYKVEEEMKNIQNGISILIIQG
ncbi:MAG: translation initiation factor IF-3 [Candidatus Moranbacteria bacterium]|nr:translation initiation factor IF-3 [Candidatus Moranbacteria bacterium]